MAAQKRPRKQASDQSEQPPQRGRDAISLPPLPMKFREALADYLKVQPDASPEPKRKARPTKRQTKAK
jgi:hypothetical protein